MKTQIRLFLLITLFLGLMPSSCNRGNCDDPHEYKRDLNDISFKFLGAGLKLDTPNTVIPQGEFIIEVSLKGDDQFVSNASPEIPLFTQTLMARDPCEPNHCSGFTVDIDSFTITCDTMFQGESAGLSLNEFFNVIYLKKNTPYALKDTMVTFSTFNEFWRKDPVFLVSSSGPEPFEIKRNVLIPPGNYRFTVTMLLKDGTLISKESDRVHFE